MQVSFVTIVAIITAFGLFIGSILIETTDFTIFLSLSSFVMVVFGTLAAAFVSYEPRYVILSLKLITRIIFTPKVGRDILKAEVGRMIRWAYVVQKGGPPALEAEATKAARGDKFLKFGVEMVISGYTGEEVREILTNHIETTFGRNTVQVNIFKAIGDSAPAFGMIGTLVGLVQMLANMDDPQSIGPAMAVALLTTLYGAVIANLVALPISDKLEAKTEEERLNKELMLEAISQIHARQSPLILADILEGFLPESQRARADEEPEGEASEAAQ